MKIYDITLPISETIPVWPGQPSIQIEPLSTVSKDGSAVSRLSFSSHTGTHVDAPAHFVEGGDTVDEIGPDKLIGLCRVLDFTWLKPGEGISDSHLEQYDIVAGERILLKTVNSQLLHNESFTSEYVHVSLEGASYLAQKGIALVGMDYLGIEKKGSPGHPVHTELLKKGIVIVEGIDLENVSAGEYELICLPLKIVGCDGSPARALLIKH